MTAAAAATNAVPFAAGQTAPVPPRVAAADFERLVMRHRDSVFVWARRLTGSATDAEDLAQETLVRAFDRFHTFHGDASAVPGWLRTILRNQFINQWRRRKNEPAFVSEESCAEAVVGGPSPEALTMHRAEASALLAAVAELDPMYRLPLVMADVEDLPYQEIADRLCLPLNTVRSRIHRARLKVQKSLAPWRPATAAATLH